MKAIGGIYDLIPTHENLATAAWRASRGKRYRPAIAAWLAEADERITDISFSLSRGNYRFSPYEAFAIRDPKSRIIHAPAFQDRVVHHAIVAIAGPVLERGAIDHSYACRAGRGQHAALDRIRRWLRPGDWFLKIDVAKFYDSVSHDELMRLLGRRFRETKLLALWSALLASFETRPGHGLPIGALTSQYLGNFYLDGIDHLIQEKHPTVRHYRYMDDFLIFGAREDLHAVRDAVAAALDRVGLCIKQGGVLNRAELGVPYLGFTLYPDRVRLNPAGRQRLRRRCREFARTLHREERDPTSRESTSLTSQFAHAAFADDVAWRRSVCRRLETFWERQGRAPRDARRLLEQHGEELPLGEPQQEPPRQPQQEPGLPPLRVLRHGESGLSPDDAFSSAPPSDGGDKSRDRRPPAPEIQSRMAEEKGAGGAAVEY